MGTQATLRINLYKPQKPLQIFCKLHFHLCYSQGRSKPQKDGQASPANLDIASSVCKAHSACNAC